MRADGELLDLRAGDRAADGAAVFPVLSRCSSCKPDSVRRRRTTPSSCCRSNCGRRAGCARRLPMARRSAFFSTAERCCATAIACRADDGRVVRVVAAAEDLLEVRCADADGARPRRLPSRQSACAVAGWRQDGCASPLTTSWRRCCADWVRRSRRVRAPFEPEAGAYAARASRRIRASAKHAGIIHDFAGRVEQRCRLEQAARMAAIPSRPARLPLVRLLQLASPALPIGAYSYSQGLEWVVGEGVVTDAASARRPGSATHWSS